METTTEITDIKANILRAANTDSDPFTGASASSRKNSQEVLREMPVPTIRHEHWKYSDIERILDEFTFSAPAPRVGFVAVEGLQNCVHLQNGQVEKIELTAALKDKVIVLPIVEAAAQYPEAVSKQLGTSAKGNKDFFTHLNNAYATSGLFIHVKDNVHVEEPVYIVQDCYDDKEALVQSHHLFLIGRNSSLKLIKKQNCSGKGAKAFHNNLTEVVVDENASFSLSRLQNECSDTYQVDNLYASVRESALLTVNNITMGGAFTRNCFLVDIDGKKANAKLTGLSIINNEQQSDAWVKIRHNQPECESDQLFKSIVDDSATATFSGKIYVARDAQKTNAFQSNKNVVLTDTANAYSKPQLEIYADDVKCSHGSTTGQIDEDALFYLRARGIRESSARKLLLYAFAANIVDRLDNEDFKAEVTELIDQKFNE